MTAFELYLDHVGVAVRNLDAAKESFQRPVARVSQIAPLRRSCEVSG